MILKLPKIELNCLKLLKIENWIENCQKINFQFFSLSEKLKIELKIAQNQFSFFWNYWKLNKMKLMFSYTDVKAKKFETFYQNLCKVFETLTLFIINDYGPKCTK